MASPAGGPRVPTVRTGRGLTEPQPQPLSQPQSLFDKTARFMAYLYLRRIPILIGGTLVIFPIAALLPTSPVASLLQNLFFLTTTGMFWTTVVALLVSWSTLLTSRLVILNGEERFGLPQKYTSKELAKLNRSFWLVMVVSLPSIAGYFTQWHDFMYVWSDCLWRTLAVFAGFICAYCLIFLALFLAVWIAPKRTQTSVLTFPCPGFMRQWLSWANCHGLVPTQFLGLGLWVRSHWPRSLWLGYISPRGFLWGGQWLSLIFSFATLGVYFGIDIYTKARLGETTAVPALVFVLLLLLNLNWILSAMAFFLDRYRIPLLVPVLLLCAADSFFPASDHYYTVKRGVAVEPVRPADVLATRAKQSKPIVIITTAGGGIQAAAWTAQVLAGLEEQSKQWGTHHRFSDAVTLISSVSGGATGAMFYLNLYHPNNEGEQFDVNGLKGLAELASKSSLDEVAWALVYHDLPKVFVAPSETSEERLFDRGYMLEESWRNRGNIQADLSNWRLGVAQGLRPAAIFNGTINETGEPLAMATTDMKSGGDPARRTFYKLYPDSDLPVVTAVRLGATFPYVTPSARALSTKPEYHVIDGGYYDNYGVASAVAWLDEAFSDLKARGQDLPEVLIIQIRSFPDDALSQPTTKGWFFQTYAPVDGLLNVRTTAQLIRDREELDNFARRWEEPEDPRKKLPKLSPKLYGSSERIHFATFEFRGHHAPLSWAMNPRQINEIAVKWKDIQTSNESDLLEVHCFFDPKYPGCKELEKGPW